MRDSPRPLTPPGPRLPLALVAAIVLTGCAYSPEYAAPERRSPERKAIAAPVTEITPTSGEWRTEQADSTRTESPPRALTIRLSAQRFDYAEAGRVVRSGPISSGTPQSPTPTGRFAVLSKERDKVSSRYTNQLGWQAWMPYSIQFNGHYFLHEGWLPGYPDSRGCVRVGEQDARFLFKRLKIGDRVEVVN